MNKPTIPIPSEDAVASGGFEALPPYSRSLLRIKVPVTVTLAATRKHLGGILELVPGTILQFEKMCDEALSLEVGGHRIAEGETVKVGEKFGLRLTSIVMPAERFLPVQGLQPAESSEAED